MSEPKQPHDVSDEALSAALPEYRVPEPSADFVDETLFRVHLDGAREDEEHPAFVDQVMERLIADPVVGGRMRDFSNRSIRAVADREAEADAVSRRFLWLPVAGLGAAAAAAILLLTLVLDGPGNADADSAWPLGSADVVSRATSVAYAGLETEEFRSGSELVVDVPLAPLGAEPGTIWR